MSSAPSRIRRSIQRAAAGLAWTTLFTVIAASAAGLAGLAWHAPGSPARAELTYPGDTALGARLDAAAVALATIARDVERLAEEAKTALEEVASLDTERLQASLARGGTLATSIDSRARALQADLADLPGTEPDAAIRYSHETLARRASTLVAVEAAVSLAGHWNAVSLRAREVGNLIAWIQRHNTVFLDAAEHGRNNRYTQAVAGIRETLQIMDTIQTLRDRLISTPGPTVLDEWIERTRAYDVAVRDLYDALRRSGGRTTLEVQAARLEERRAYENLPPDGRAVLVAIGEVARGGLTQAVVAIEDAHGRLDDAIAALESPAPGGSRDGSPGASRDPGASGAPDATPPGSTAPEASPAPGA
ncbi:MAG TPA: hypothetical protein VNL94_05715 [Candidatus Binatia bacterium]|nr:hypothetical protein [Candidatus Binatia bacterium]